MFKKLKKSFQEKNIFVSDIREETSIDDGFL